MSRLDHVRRLWEGKADPNLFSPKYVSHAPWDRAVQAGAKGQHGEAKPMFRAETVFSELKPTLEEVFEDGDKVVVRWRVRGTWAHPIPGINIKPTGQHIDLTGINIYHFSGDQIIEKHGQFDVGAFNAEACKDVRAQDIAEALAALHPSA